MSVRNLGSGVFATALLALLVGSVAPTAPAEVRWSTWSFASVTILRVALKTRGMSRKISNLQNSVKIDSFSWLQSDQALSSSTK